jgi:cellulose synthase/poly-beta-1,6-N-acetylglucosamine synthase-like glycosyltransferase
MSRLAVLLPCFNEELVIANTIKSILAAGLDTHDVFVIDDCSKDKTAEIAQSFRVNVISNPRNMGKIKSIDSAIKSGRISPDYELISILDADTSLDKEYFLQVQKTFAKDPEIAGVCGQPMSVPHNWLTAYRAFEYAFVHSIYKEAQHKIGAINISAGCATTYRHDVLRQIDWHPDRIIIEDADITPQVHRKRLGKIVYNKKAIVHTQDPETLQAYTKQVKRWYTGIWQAWPVYKIPFGGQAIDYESLFLGGEALLSSLVVLMTPVWFMLNPQIGLRLVLLSQVPNFLFVAYFSLKLRRLDIALFSPLFVIPRTINRLMYLTAFVNAIVRGQKAGSWYKPERYNQSTIA